MFTYEEIQIYVVVQFRQGVHEVPKQQQFIVGFR
jgi:hypothetical protein